MSTAATSERAGRWRSGRPGRFPAAGGVLVFAVVLAVGLASPMAVSADSLRSVFVGVAMLRHGTLDIEGFSPSWTMGTDFAIVRENGAWLPFFPWAPSAFVVPLLAIADAYLRLTGDRTVEDTLSESYSTWPFEVISMSLVVALTAVVVYAIAWSRLSVLPAGRRRAAAVAVALVFALGTSEWSTSSRSLWQHGPELLFVALALLGASRLVDGTERPRGAALLVGAAAAAAFTMRPTAAVLIGVLAVWLLVRHREAAVWALLGGLPVAAVFVGVNLAEYGRVLPGYFVPGQSDSGGREPDLAQALVANLVSPARGILVFSPVLLLVAAGLVLAVRRGRLDGLLVVSAAHAVLHWVVVSSFPHWWAGYSYGPRFMSDVVPSLVVLCLPAVAWLAGHREVPVSRLTTRAAGGVAAVLVALSVAAHAQGALTRSSWCWNSTPDVNENTARLWDWSDAQVTAGLRGIAANGWDAETVRGGTAQYGCEGLTR